MTTYCFYHKVDFDGKASAAIVKKFVPDAILKPFNYDMPFPYAEVKAEDTVYFVDVAAQPYAEMIKIHLAVKKLVIIDHHKSFIESGSGQVLRAALPEDFLWSFNFAGCELTWMYFTKQVPPYPIRLLGQYDNWRDSPEKMNQNDTDWDTVLLFQYGLRRFPFDIDSFTKDFLDDAEQGELNVFKTVAEGRVILDYQINQNASAMGWSFDVTIKGFKCLCVNSGGANSQLFASKWDPEKYDFMVAFSYSSGHKWSFSFYTTREDRDASELAKLFGGGGHKGAAGCYSSELIWDERGCIEEI